jgi:hypothetical protein
MAWVGYKKCIATNIAGNFYVLKKNRYTAVALGKSLEKV